MAAAGAEPPPIRYKQGDRLSGMAIIAEGDDQKEAMQQAARAVSAHHVENIANVEIIEERSVSVEGYDLVNLICRFLNEFLFLMSPHRFVAKDVVITEFDDVNFRITATARGETFDEGRHGLGTEIRGIFSDTLTMELNGDSWQLFVPFDA